MSYFSHYGNEGKGAGQAVSPRFIRESAGLAAANGLPRLQPGPDLLGARECRQGARGSEWPRRNTGVSDEKSVTWGTSASLQITDDSTNHLASPPTTDNPGHQPAGGATSPTWELERGGNYKRKLLKWPLLVPAWARTNVFEWTTCIKQHLKYGTFSTLWIWNAPFPQPHLLQCTSSPRRIFLSFSRWNGWHTPDVTQGIHFSEKA